MLPLPTAARPDLGTPVNKNRHFRFETVYKKTTMGVPPERLVGSVCAAGSARAGLHSQNPSLPKTVKKGN